MLPAFGAGSSSWSPRFNGDTPAGSIRWGLSYGSNTDPYIPHEQPADHRVGLRRTFWSWNQGDSMAKTATSDLAIGRLPWVSIKPPVQSGTLPDGRSCLAGMSWLDVAAGKHDAALDATLLKLKAVPGPVWFTVNHEPEGGNNKKDANGYIAYPTCDGRTDDDPSHGPGFVAMNRHVKERLIALGVKNVAFAPILMEWSFSNAATNNWTNWRTPDKWFGTMPNGTQIWDFFGIDAYADGAKAPHDAEGWQRMRPWAKAKGLDIGVAEFGIDTKGDWTEGARQTQRWYDALIASATDGKGARVLGAAAFDTTLNGGVPMQREQLDKFHVLMNDPRSILVNEAPSTTTTTIATTTTVATTTTKATTTTAAPTTTAPPSSTKPTVAFVVGNPASLGRGDSAVRDRLARTYTVTVVDDNSSTLLRTAQAASVAIVSNSADAATIVNSKLNTITKPVLTWEPWAYRAFGLISSDPVAVSYDGTIVRADGTPLPITSVNGTLYTGTIGGDVQNKGTVSNKPVLFGYASGKKLANGTVAPACRVAYATYQDLPASFTATGWDRFITTVERARTTCDL